MTRVAAALILLATALPAMAQTTSSPPNGSTGVVGGFAVGVSGDGGGGRAASRNATTGAASGARAGSSRGGGFVLCPPSGASGEAAFLIGTDLSCAPQ